LGKTLSSNAYFGYKCNMPTTSLITSLPHDTVCEMLGANSTLIWLMV